MSDAAWPDLKPVKTLRRVNIFWALNIDFYTFYLEKLFGNKRQKKFVFKMPSI